MVPSARRVVLALLPLALSSAGAQEHAKTPADQAAALVRAGEEALTRPGTDAAGAFETAAALARSAGSDRELGRALNGLSIALLGSDLARSRSAAEESIRVHERLQDPEGSGEAWNNFSNTFYYGGEYHKAIDAAHRALAFWTAANNRVGMARALGNIGNNNSALGSYDEAEEYFERARVIFEELGDRNRTAVVTGNIAVIHHRRGNYPEALEYSRRSLAMREAIGNEMLIGKELDTLGNIYRSLGAYGRALQTLTRSLALRRKFTDIYAIAETEHNIGLVHFSQGQYQRAIDAYKRGLALASKSGTSALVPEALTNIGGAAWRLGQFDRARANFLASLAIAEREGYEASRGANLAALGHLAVEQGRLREAGERFARALAIHEARNDHRNTVNTLNGMARLHLSRKRFEDAAAVAARSAEMSARFEQNEELWEALTLAGTAYRRLGRTADARRSLREAVDVVERLRNDVAGRPVEGERFFATKLSPYHELIALAVEGNAPAEALATAERAKARTLADIRRAGNALGNLGLTVVERREERRLQSALRSINRRVLAERMKESPDDERLRGLELQREALRTEYDTFQSALYARRPALRLTRGEPAPFELGDAAALVNRPSTAVLEFVVADEATYAFVLTGAGGRVDVASHRLGIPRRALEERVRRLRGRLAARDLLFAQDARELYDLLLAPAARALRGKAHLVIVPDGPLWETPFQALQDGAGRYVVEAAAVSYAPSLTVLHESMRAVPTAAPRTLLAMGKADFGSKTAGSLTLMSDLGPLPEAERQVRQLPAIYGDERSTVYVGSDATEDRFKAEAPRHPIVHVASHGLFEESSPLYSSVVLTPGAGDAGEDGLLEAWELLDMRLAAELVVLSACETGRGRIASGEGIVGTMWALLASGAESAVVSQWKVEASSTTELMIAFHTRLARGEPGKADHLREATLAVMRDPRYAHPFYWAPFVLVGNPL